MIFADKMIYLHYHGKLLIRISQHFGKLWALTFDVMFLTYLKTFSIFIH